jgi:hypothetical protein
MITRALLTVAAVLVFQTSAQALKIAKWGVQFGAGWTNQSMGFEESSGRITFDPDESLVGPIAGTFVEFRGVGRTPFSGLVEVLYSQRGVGENELTDAAGIRLGDLKQKGHFLSIPVSVKLFHPRSTITPFFTAGLGVEFLLGREDDDFRILEDFNTANLGGHLSAGVDAGRIGASIRYYRDLFNSYDPADSFRSPQVSSLDSVKNEGFLVILMLSIGS